MIQDDLVEVPPTRLPPYVFLDHVSSQLVQVDGVGERFAGKIEHSDDDRISMLRDCSPGGLDAEPVVNISNVEPLAVNSTETDCPLGWVSPGQLGDVGGWLPSHVRSALVVNTFDIKNELIELGYDELAPECFGDEDVTLLQKPEVIPVKYQSNTSQSSPPRYRG